MATAQDIKFLMSGGKTNTTKNLCLGGYPSEAAGGVLLSSSSNNFFENVSKTDQVSGKDYYLCFYVQNNHATEKMEQFKWWLGTDTLEPDNVIKWGFENVANSHKYRFAPYYTATGSSFLEEPDDPTLDLSTFTVVAWFKTSTNFTTEAMIINKGGLNSDSSGENMNYGIWMNATEQIVAGFETASGTDNYVTSPSTYNDGNWHLAIVTYDLVTLKLYMDGNTTPVATLATTSTPETNAKPLTLAKNSRADELYFTGEIDEVQVYNTAWTSTTVANYYNDGSTWPSGLGRVFGEEFGRDWGQLIAQTIPNINTAPSGITWNTVNNAEPAVPNAGGGLLNPTEYFPVWVWWHVDANAKDAGDSSGIFNFKFLITILGTGGEGGGSTPPPSPPPPGQEPPPDPPGGGGGNPPPTPSAFSISSVGDMGAKSMTTTIANLIVSRAPKVFLGLGDYSYDSSISGWKSRVDVIKQSLPTIVFKGCMGNHDVDSSSKKNDVMAYLNITKTYYSFDVENVHFLVLDSESSFSTSSAQYAFVQADLAATANNSLIQWIIACDHRPWFGADSKHPYNENNIVDRFHPLFDQYNVDLILCGHNHNMQFTYPVTYNSSDPEDPIVADSTSGPYTRGVGRIHIVSGGGGHDSGSALYSLGSQPSFQQFQDDNSNGICEIAFSNNNQTMTVRMLNEDADELYSVIINR